MFGRWMIAGLIALAPMAAHAQSSVTVAIDEEVTATIGADGTAAVTGRKPAQANRFESASLDHFNSGAMDDAIGPNAKPMGERPGVATPTPVPGLLKLRFTSGERAGEKQSMLVVENGYDRAMVYRATIKVDGKPGPTDVCLVMPGKLGLEHWPYAIESIELSAIRLQPWTPEDGLPCA